MCLVCGKKKKTTKKRRTFVIKIECMLVLITSASVCKVHFSIQSTEKLATTTERQDNDLYRTLPMCQSPNEFIWPNWKLNVRFICALVHRSFSSKLLFKNKPTKRDRKKETKLNNTQTHISHKVHHWNTENSDFVHCDTREKKWI